MQTSSPPPTRLGRHWRGYLPHFEGGAIPQFITFRLAGSLPAEKLLQWELELKNWPPDSGEREKRRRIEEYLDQGHGETWLRDPAIAKLVEDALLYFDGQRYRLPAWIVMPNHVHTLVTPCEGWTVSKTVASWKSFTAKEAGKILGRKGRFWQPDYFDRFVRNEKQFLRVVDYIEENPVKAGLCAAREDWLFSSARRRQAGVAQDDGNL